MSFLDNLRQERLAREEARFQAPARELEAKRQAEEETRRRIEEYRRLRTLACRYYAESGCAAYIQEILANLKARGFYNATGDWSLPLVNEPYGSVTRPEHGEELTGGVVTYIRWATILGTSRESQYPGATVTWSGLKYHIRIEMRPDGTLVISGKKKIDLPLEHWRKDVHQIDAAFQQAFASPQTAQGLIESRYVPPDNDDHGIGL